MEDVKTISKEHSYNIFSADFIRAMFKGVGQVMFQDSAWTGLLIMCGIFWGAYGEGQSLVAWGALVGVFVSTVTGYIVGLPHKDGSQGLWGFNGVLVGCAFPTFLGDTVFMWLALIFCSAMTTWVRTALNNIMAPWKVNSFTFPFVFMTWLFLMASRQFGAIPTPDLSAPALPAATINSFEYIGFGDLVVYWLKGIAQVFLINSWVTGIFFLVALYVCNKWSALWAAISSAVALFIAIVFKAPGSGVEEGLFGFSAVLTGIAIGSIFYPVSWKSALWALLGVIATVFIQAGMNVWLEPLGIPTLTGPFCLTTWLFLLPLFKFRIDYPDHSNWDKTNKTHLDKSMKKQPKSAPATAEAAK